MQNKNAHDDSTKTALGIIIFWPILFSTSGDGQVASELAHVRGEKQALEETIRAKNCGNAQSVRKVTPKKYTHYKNK